MIEIENIVTKICQDFSGVVAKSSWGETALFFNPDGKLPNGVYFCTFKAQDGANDQSSGLGRDGVFRIAIGVSAKTYALYFGTKPARPLKGGVVKTGHDFSALDTITPHPIYAWMNWIQILSPSADRLDEIFPLIDDAYTLATKKYQQRIRKL